VREGGRGEEEGREEGKEGRRKGRRKREGDEEMKGRR